jgi:hypothetical protein
MGSDLIQDDFLPHKLNCEISAANRIGEKAMMNKSSALIYLAGNSTLLRWLRLFMLAFTASLLTGCSEKMVAVSVTGYNHMPDDGGWSVAPFSVNGAGGPNLSPADGGGKSSCCVMIPEKWHPGTKVKVYWRYTERDNDPRAIPPPQVAEVEIPDYSEEGPGKVNVHFYADNRIKVVVTSYGIESPRYPMRAADKLPWKTWEHLLKFDPLWQEKKP